MSELQNFIDEERKNIAKAIIVDDLCNGREDKEQRCKRCRFKCLINRDRRFSFAFLQLKNTAKLKFDVNQ